KGATKQLTIAPGAGLIGQSWVTEKPLWLQDLATASQLARVMAAEREGLHSAFCFPIKLEEAITGVLEFWAPQVRGESDVFVKATSDISSQIAAHLGRFLERERTEERMRSSEERYRGITEIAQDAIVTIDDGSQILSVNQATERLFGYTRNELV